MQIHVVQENESVFSIANLYGVNANELIMANEIPNPDTLVPGQTMVIPIVGRYYFVQPGDSLYSIARRFNTTVEQIAQINQLNVNEPLQPGLRLYLPPQPKTEIEVNGYIEPRPPLETEPRVISRIGPWLTYVSVFSYQVTREGELIPVPDEPSLEASALFAIAPVLVITNIEGDNFNPELGEAILQSEALQDKVLTEAISVMEEKGYRSLNIDFEHLRPEDREPYNAFLRKAADRLRATGYTLSTALAPKVGPEQVGAWYEAHDYPAHGEIVDFTVLMTYEWGWSGGPPMAVAPLDQVRRVVEYAVSVMPANKVMMGIPLYGYDWTLPYEPGGEFARAISPQEALLIAARYGATIQYDETAQSPFFTYRDVEGRDHEVWFEDARSIEAKFQLVKELGLRGVSYWVLRIEIPQNWLLIQEHFSVRKI
ncbi:glycoside hydrolase family 18 protein [Halalkalibacterium halodurans]|uniref:BH2292 protein n=2 Tax=Halalkalibacterium halodurans TaxID=86665 RepID=Q9KAJ5_HALH5|nr:glycoside hydrolase family 18 protein [Halalkalibacterium halodurans]MED4080926.1 glycoside hydrolase family 18 protein [Halalkalibacterium halodurans]MED4085109.1 glycoside hydrolase family 18 protein [Halalkalibacterium halodurans]MED4105313.1 glycoside hydrolase family 18 protein [Halalkalibacterium halodurans]MED4109122.1 glycoside hydrolase family 18 protein [Halalkalibacterium halodurans]MED4148968.1 glycoside hydrolase family 18 protein [Halalkalibacterium halodurans]